MVRTISLPPRAGLTLDKPAAAARQVEAAIEAFERGDFDVAITLAGAAEGMLPEIENQALFRMLRDHPRVPAGLPRRDWISILNADRDWLKHQTTEIIGVRIELDANDGAVMILRALAKIPDPVWSEVMEAFKSWAIAHGFGPDGFLPPLELFDE